MAIKNKEAIAALNIPDEDKTDLSRLFDDLTRTNSEIADLRKKNDDANKTVQRLPEMEKLLQTKEQQSAELQAKLDALTTKSPTPVLAEDDGGNDPLAVVRAAFGSLLGSD